MSDSIKHSFFSGLGANNYSSSLPVQTLLESQKNKKWKKAVLDRLEQIAENQLVRNLEFRDYYRMLEGDLIYTDYGLPDLTKEIVRLRDEVDFPVHAKHYDFLGMMVNQIKGEYPSIKDSYKVDNTDPTSQNEFTRARTEELQAYTQKLFNLELEQRLLQKGIIIDPNRQFNSQEEQQQYMQELEQQKAQLIAPEHIQKQMQKSWKTVAASWAERTLEYDQQRFELDKLNTQEIEDYFLTGRYFRHYHIGYDYYKPERWNPCTTFFSEDLNAEYPQEGEYVGTVHFLSPSDIINRYGDKLTEDIHRRLSGFFNKESYGSVSQSRNLSLEDTVKKNFGETQYIPFEGYHDYDLTLQLQDVFQTPFGETYIEENGEQKKVPAWFSPINNGNNYFRNHWAQELRSDIEVRTDLLQVTEAYWRSFKRIGLLNYVNEEGFFDQVITTDDLLPEFLKENEISTLRRVSLEECENDPKPNTICYTWIPEVRWGVKIKAGNSYLTEDLYIGGDALPYQIKGNSNIYDVQLPVAGYIGKSTAKKIRPFIIKYNIVLNQIHSLLEKELGTFFLFDVHYLPSEYKNGDTRQQLEEMYTLIQELGIVPVDTSKQNMQGNQPAMNAFMTQSLDFTNLIANRMNLANQFKLMALEQIGITQQRIGNPGEYTTTEGIKQGMMASYAQTQPIYDVMSTSARRANLLHLNIAQYCQKNNKDYSFIYTKSDGEKAFIELSDPYFSVREWGLVPIGTSKDKKALENVRNIILNDNTMGADVLTFAEIALADSITQLIEIGRSNRIEADRRTKEQQQHEQTLADKQIQAAADQKQNDREWEEKLLRIKIDGDIQESRINALGRAADKKSDSEGFERIEQAAQDEISNEFKSTEIGLKEADQARKISKDLADYNLKLQEMALKKRDQQLKEKELATKKEIAYANKN